MKTCGMCGGEVKLIKAGDETLERCVDCCSLERAGIKEVRMDSFQLELFNSPVKITKKLIKGFIRMKLATNDAWALRALRVIYSRQTADEQETGTTCHSNNVGFSGIDAEFLTSLANQYQNRGSLSFKQLKILHKIMPKYWRQILEMSDVEKVKLQMGVPYESCLRQKQMA